MGREAITEFSGCPARYLGIYHCCLQHCIFHIYVRMDMVFKRFLSPPGMYLIINSVSFFKFCQYMSIISVIDGWKIGSLVRVRPTTPVKPSKAHIITPLSSLPSEAKPRLNPLLVRTTICKPNTYNSRYCHWLGSTFTSACSYCQTLLRIHK